MFEKFFLYLYYYQHRLYQFFVLIILDHVQLYLIFARFVHYLIVNVHVLMLINLMMNIHVIMLLMLKVSIQINLYNDYYELLENFFVFYSI